VTIIQPAAAVRRRPVDQGPRGAARRGPARRAPELAPLGLDQLRAYRQELIQEESRVSYWRRILQARLDLALADRGSLDRLRRVLSAHQQTSRRLAMQPFDGHVDVAPLPDLAVLWETQSGGGDDTELVTRLADAEQQLSAYRRVLHQRLDAATGELISRYRDDPSLALRALPLPPVAEAGVA